jgi:hypothetical protein
MRLAYDATPADFFDTLVRLSADACAKCVPGQRRGWGPGKVTGLESFERAIATLRSRLPGVDVRFVYLLDESKRIINDRFPRGFHDNLFHLLFGGSGIQGYCNIVFAGAQELYRLCEDDTSPIGSRAAKHSLTNLSVDAICEMTDAIVADPDGAARLRLANEVYHWTGGHAGLSAALLRSLVRSGGSAADVTEAVRVLRLERSELFQVWVNSLTHEGRVIHDALLNRGSLNDNELIEELRRNSLPVHRYDRAAEELQYVGLARRESSDLMSCNRVYSELARLFVRPQVGSDLERTVWSLVEQTEVGLRKMVRVAFEGHWRNQADDMIHSALGDQSWAVILANREKYAKAYPRNQQTTDASDVLDFAYLGQLGQLITWNKAWGLFRVLFKDKREFEDMIHDIVPVRNDSAHFRTVPELELNRCRVRCVDLLAIIEMRRDPTSSS